MLQTIRDNSKGVMAGLLIGFLVIIFALSGAEALFSGSNRSNDIASVGGESITETQLTREIYQQRQQILNQYGDDVPSEFVSDERLREPALNNLIQRQVMVQHATEQGMGISEESLDQIIVGLPQFAGDDGQFDSNRYQQVLRSMGFTPTQYKALLRQELLLNQLSAGIASSGIVTQGELEQVAALNFQTRDLQYLVLTEDRVAEEVEVTDEDIEAYYQDNRERYRQPDQVAVDYIELSVDTLMERIDIDEQAVRDQYEQNQQARSGRSADRRVSHILFEDPDDERVADVREALDAGEPFGELAEEFSDDFGSSGQGGDLGYLSNEGLPDAFVDAAESLEVGEVSEPVRTDAGVHLIKVTEEDSEEAGSFEDEREEIARQLKRVEAENQFAGLMDRLGELSYNTDSLEPVAEELDLPLDNTGLFTRDGGEEVASESEVVEAAFSDEVLERNNSSDLIELESDRILVIKKTDYEEAYIQPLDEVRDEIARRLTEQRTRSLLAERAETLMEALKGGEAPEAVAEQTGVEWTSVDDLERGDRSLPGSLVRHAFSLPRPDDTEAVISGTQTDEGYALVRLTGVQDGRWSELGEDQRQSLRRSLAQSRGQQEFSAYRQYLQSEADIER